MKDFLNRVNDAYESFDDDRMMLERSLDLSSNELLDLNLELRALFQSLPDLIFVVDMDGKILDCKGGFDSDLVIPRKDYKGKSFFKYPNCEILSANLINAFEDVCENIKNVSVEYSLELNGKQKFYEATFLNLEQRQIIVVVKDLTQRMKTEETLKRNFLEISKKNIFESIFANVSRSVHKSLKFSDIMELVVEELYNKVDNVDYVAIYEIEREKANLLSYKGYPDWFNEKLKVIEYPQGATWSCINNRKTIHSNNLNEDKNLGDAAKKAGTKSYIATPIFLHESPIGCIHIHSKNENAFDENEINFLESLSRQIATAINTSLQARALEESEQRYRTLFDQSPVGICIVDRSLKITHCNQSMVDIFQSDFDKVVGLDLNHLSDKSFVPIVKKALSGEVSSHETFYKATTSSAELWLNARVVPLNGLRNDEVVGALAVVEDITERRNAENKLKESEERFRGIIEHSYDLVIETSQDGKYLYLSPNCYDILGYKQEELIGRSIFEHIHPDDLADVIKEFSSAIKEFRPGNIVFRHQHSNGSIVWLDVSGKPYKTASNKIKAVITCHDVTDRKT